MKNTLTDYIVRGMLLAALVWFGIRGVLPDIIAGGELLALILLGAAFIAVFAFAPYVYEAYRCANRCETTCNPRLCRAQ